MAPADGGQRRILGRILSLGFPLPGARADNYDFLSAPSFFDYDAIVVDVGALSRLMEGVLDGSIDARTFGGRPVRNTPAAPEEIALRDVLDRRRDETAMLLDRGGAVICFAHAPVTHASIAGGGPLDDYYWLGEHAPAVTAAEGSQAQVVDYAHPLAAFVHAQLANIAYRVRLAPDAERRGCVFVRSAGGAPIGAELPLPRGRLVLLPALRAVPPGDARYAMSDALQAGVRRLVGAMAEGRPPPWVTAHELPGLADLRRVRDDAQARLKDAARALADADAAHDELARYQRLLWQEGPLGLDDVVLDALRQIGCEVYTPERSGYELRVDGARVLLEVEASETPVGLAAHYRLRQRIEAAIEQTRQAPRGLLVVNGYRLTAPSQRPPQADDPLRTAAETLRYPVLTTMLLFDALVAALSGDHAPAAALRARIVSESGLLA